MAVVSLQNVWKRFTIANRRTRTIRELLRRVGQGVDGKRDPDILWALRDVSLEIQPGETFGLIGSNGSGKSTILKLISAIMLPTKGRVRVQGSVSALIELGAGFHPEFSGRDNIFVYATLLGLPREQVRRKFDLIVDFAELGQFIDAPVKHYSSGMYMRLAFAIAAHVEPHVLLIDEVLAVGDEAFQRKCLARVRDLQRTGVTAVFVSHALSTVAEISDRVGWIDRGNLRQVGPANAVVAAYHASVGPAVAEPATVDGKILEVQLLDEAGRAVAGAQSGDPVQLRVTLLLDRAVQNPTIGLRIALDSGMVLTDVDTRRLGVDLGFVPPGAPLTVLFRVPSLPLLGAGPNEERLYQAIGYAGSPLNIPDLVTPFAVRGNVANGLIDFRVTAQQLE